LLQWIDGGQGKPTHILGLEHLPAFVVTIEFEKYGFIFGSKDLELGN